jgi:hypothetical protein
MALVNLGCTLPLMTPISNDAGGCTCPSSSSMILICTASRAIMYRPASSALVAETIRFLMMCAMFSINQLFGGTVILLERKKCPLARLCAVGSLN